MKLRTIKSTLLAAIAAIAFNFAPHASCQSESSAIDLFNGKDFTGWKAFLEDPKLKLEHTWSVRDGMIVCTGEPLGYLYTERKFTNFKLQADYRWTGKPGNSGLFSRINGEHQTLPRCIETQLKHGDAGDVFGFHGFVIRGAADRFKEKESKLAGHVSIVKKITGAEKEPGQWNHAEVVVNGKNVIVHVNGQKVNEATDAEIISGPVALQSEGGEIHFRNVKITPIGN